MFLVNHVRRRQMQEAQRGLVTRRYPVSDLVNAGANRATSGSPIDELPLLITSMTVARTSLEEKRQELIVTAAPDVLSRVEQALADLRQNRGQQIAVTIRVLNLSDKPTGVSRGDPDEALVLDLANEVFSLKPGQRVHKLLNTVQAMKVATIVAGPTVPWRSRTITAPRITLFNGQRGYITVGTSTAYVSGFGARRLPDASLVPEPQISACSTESPLRPSPCSMPTTRPWCCCCCTRRSPTCLRCNQRRSPIHQARKSW
jgi:hypothetical protein